MWDSSVPKEKEKEKENQRLWKKTFSVWTRGSWEGHIMRCIAQRNQVGSMHELLYILILRLRGKGDRRSLGIFQRISQLLRSTLSH
jgi:hypothetical protein